MRDQVVGTVTSSSSLEPQLPKVEKAQLLSLRASSAASLHGDPVAAQLQAILCALGAMTDIHDAIFAKQAEFQRVLKSHSANIVKNASEIACASATWISKELGPELIAAAVPTVRQSLRTLRVRSVVGAAVALAAIVLLVGAFAYTSGLSTGRDEGEEANHCVQGAMADWPTAAMDCALLMADNNPVPALADCRKDILTSANGRHYCSMLVWLDPPSSPPR